MAEKQLLDAAYAGTTVRFRYLHRMGCRNPLEKLAHREFSAEGGESVAVRMNCDDLFD